MWRKYFFCIYWGDIFFLDSGNVYEYIDLGTVCQSCTLWIKPYFVTESWKENDDPVKLSISKIVEQMGSVKRYGLENEETTKSIIMEPSQLPQARRHEGWEWLQGPEERELSGQGCLTGAGEINKPS